MGAAERAAAAKAAVPKVEEARAEAGMVVVERVEAMVVVARAAAVMAARVVWMVGVTALGMGDLSTPGGSYRRIPHLHNSHRRA